MPVNDSERRGVSGSNITQAHQKLKGGRLVAVSAIPALLVAAICIYLMRGSRSCYEAYPIRVNGKAITAQARSFLTKSLISGCTAPRVCSTGLH